MNLSKFKLTVVPGRIITRNNKEVDLSKISDADAEQLLKEDPTLPYIVPVTEEKPKPKADKG